jgi:hypothetical protein
MVFIMVPREAKRGPIPAKRSIKLVTRLSRFLGFSFKIIPPKNRRMAPQAKYTEATNIWRLKTHAPVNQTLYDSITPKDESSKENSLPFNSL